MLEVLKFIFSSFWIWLGTVILVGTICNGIAGLFRIQFNRNKKD